jgi:hypothetical protein
VANATPLPRFRRKRFPLPILLAEGWLKRKYLVASDLMNFGL